MPSFAGHSYFAIPTRYVTTYFTHLYRKTSFIYRDAQSRPGLLATFFFFFLIYRNFSITWMPYLSVGLYSFDLQLSICTVGIANFDYIRDLPAVIYGVGKKCPTSPVYGASWPWHRGQLATHLNSMCFFENQRNRRKSPLQCIFSTETSEKCIKCQSLSL